MAPEELKKIAAKIAKCLALTASDNQSEAEAAKRQADALMKKYNLSSSHVAASNVSEESVDTGSGFKIPPYIGVLSVIIAEAFSCGTICELGFIDNTQVKFFGVGIKPNLAAYTFDVLRRQVLRDRAKFNAGQNSRLKRTTKIRRSDLFCQAWVNAISRQVNEFAGNETEKQAISAYKEQKYGGRLREDPRPGASAKHGNDWLSSAAGHLAAKDVSLHTPVQNKRGSLLSTCH